MPKKNKKTPILSVLKKPTDDKKSFIPETDPVIDPIDSQKPAVHEQPQQSAQSATGGPKDKTRKIIATIYVCAFLGIVIITLLIMLLVGCYTINDIKDVLLTESGILSGPLGFIIGFYFKEELDKKG